MKRGGSGWTLLQNAIVRHVKQNKTLPLLDATSMRGMQDNLAEKTEQIKLKQKRYRISFDGCLKCKQDTSEGNTAHLRAICFA